MPGSGAAAGQQDLRRCLLDLVALSALPAGWRDHAPRQIAEGMAAALLPVLGAEFVWIWSDTSSRDLSFDVIRTRQSFSESELGRVRAALTGWFQSASPDRTAKITNPFGDGEVHLAAAGLLIHGEAAVVAGGKGAGFPTEEQQIVLDIAANELSAAFQAWQAPHDRSCLASVAEGSTAFVVALTGLDGQIRYLNPYGLAIAGLKSLEEARGKHFSDFLMPHEQARMEKECWPLFVQDGRWLGELAFRHFENGVSIPLRIELFRFDDQQASDPPRAAIIGVDLTAQKRLEAELRRQNALLKEQVASRTSDLAKANRLLVNERAGHADADARLSALQIEFFHAARLSTGGEMAAALAHELSQPLAAAANSVNAARRLLARGNHRRLDTLEKVLDEASGQILRTGDIVRRLREFVSRGQIDRRAEDIRKMIDEALALAMPASEGKGVTLNVHIDPRASTVVADRIQMQQVLINLIRNALEAMAGCDRRELTVSALLRNEDVIEIAVADTGPGLSEEILENLFTPFHSTKEDGMGLGLSICRSIVEAHGGRIWLDPDVAQGAAFHFTLHNPARGQA